jgi:hypothetical protein
MQQVARAFDCSPSSLQILHKGSTFNIGDASLSLPSLADGGELLLAWPKRRHTSYGYVIPFRLLGCADVLMAMPKRKAPSAHIVSAALSRQNGRAGRGAGDDGDDDDREEEDKPAQLPPGAPRWEVAAVSFLRAR